MALNKITYDDKVQVNENSDYTAQQKVQATDMNEIKEVVNAAVDDINNKNYVYFTEYTEIEDSTSS